MDKPLNEYRTKINVIDENNNLFKMWKKENKKRAIKTIDNIRKQEKNEQKMEKK